MTVIELIHKLEDYFHEDTKDVITTNFTFQMVMSMRTSLMIASITGMARLFFNPMKLIMEIGA